MQELNLSDVLTPNNNLNRALSVRTGVSRKARPDDEINILMKTARRRFLKSLATGEIIIVSDREWTLR